MTEVVECFVVCHWAVSCNKLTERHVSRAAINVIEVISDGLCQPRELYESLIETFSKEGDLILDIGSGNGKLIISLSFSMKRWFTLLFQIKFERKKSYLENVAVLMIITSILPY